MYNAYQNTGGEVVLDPSYNPTLTRNLSVHKYSMAIRTSCTHVHVDFERKLFVMTTRTSDELRFLRCMGIRMYVLKETSNRAVLNSLDINLDLFKNLTERAKEELLRRERYATMYNRENWGDIKGGAEKLPPSLKVLGKRTLKPHQQIGTYLLLQRLLRYGSALLGDSAGVGKTLPTIACIKYFKQKNPDLRILIITTNNLVENIRQELLEGLAGLKYKVHILRTTGVTVMSKNMERMNVNKADIVLANYEKFRSDKTALFMERTKGYDFIILDEVHALRGEQQKTGSTIKDCFFSRINKPKKWTMPMVLGLSGTFIANTHKDIFHVLEYLGLNWALDNYYKKDLFYDRFIKSKKVQKDVGDKSISLTMHSNTGTDDELINLLTRTIFIRRSTEILDLKPHTYNTIDFILPAIDPEDNSPEGQEMNAEILEKATHIGRYCELALKGSGNMTKEDKKEWSNVRRLLGFDKVPFLADKLPSLLQKHGKIIVVIDNIAVGEKLEMTCNDIGIKCKFNYGKVKVDERQKNLRLFQRGEISLLISQVRLINEGLNITESKKIIFLQLPTVPSDVNQVSGRISRIGQTEETESSFCIFSNSQELRALSNLLKKSSTSKHFREEVIVTV